MTFHMYLKLAARLVKVSSHSLADLKEIVLSRVYYSAISASMIVGIEQTIMVYEKRSKPTVHHTGACTKTAKTSGNSNYGVATCV